MKRKRARLILGGVYACFLSWSGDRSKHVAEVLKPWLKDVLSHLEPWMSDHDIDPGSRWAMDLGEELQESHAGVLCLTPENLVKRWLLFEAGALSKSLTIGRVIPYRFHLRATEVAAPLSQFQGVDADKEGTLRLIETLNKSEDGTPVVELDRLKRAFEKWWPDLDAGLKDIPKFQGDSLPKREVHDYLEETLTLIRKLDTRTSLSDVAEMYANLVRTLEARAKDGPKAVDNYIGFVDLAHERGDELAGEAVDVAEVWKRWREKLR